MTADYEKERQEQIQKFQRSLLNIPNLYDVFDKTPWKDLVKLSMASKHYKELVSNYGQLKGQKERLLIEQKEEKAYQADLRYSIYSKNLFEVMDDWTPEELNEYKNDQYASKRFRDIVTMYRQIVNR